MTTLNQLRAFAAVADAGSVRAAADRLVVTQPSVSAALAALQSELGVPLLVRHGRGVRLTTAGQAYAGYVRRVLGLLDEGAAAHGKLAPERGLVRLAAVTTVGEHVLPPFLARFLARFRERYPDAAVAVEVGDRRHVDELLAEHRVDLVIGGRPPGGVGLVTLATRGHELVAVASPELAASGDGSAEQVWLLREPGSGTRVATEELLGELGMSPSTWEIGSNGAIRETLAAGLGVSLLSSDAVERDIATGRLVPWHDERLCMPRTWCVATHRESELPATAGLFLAELCLTPSGLTSSGRSSGAGLPRRFHPRGEDGAARAS